MNTVSSQEPQFRAQNQRVDSPVKETIMDKSQFVTMKESIYQEDIKNLYIYAPNKQL